MLAHVDRLEAVELLRQNGRTGAILQSVIAESCPSPVPRVVIDDDRRTDPLYAGESAGLVVIDECAGFPLDLLGVPDPVEVEIEDCPDGSGLLMADFPG